MTIYNLQISINKYQIIPNIQIPKSKQLNFVPKAFVIVFLEFNWNLQFGFCDFNINLNG